MIAGFPTWSALETALAARPKREVVRLAVRAAARLVPVIAEGSGDYGPEAIEWANAADAVVKTVEAAGTGEPVSRFTLDLAAEIARGTANSAAATVRLLGPSPAATDSEYAFAAAAFAADAARLSSSGRIAAAAMQALRIVWTSGRVPEELLTADVTTDSAEATLWPDGEPAWFTTGRAALAAASGLPVVLAIRPKAG